MKRILLVFLISCIVLAGSLYYLSWKYLGNDYLGTGDFVAQQIEVQKKKPEAKTKRVFKKENEDLPEHYIYYYEKLGDKDQQAYREIYYVIKNHGVDVHISAIEMSDMQRILQYVIWDNPELFYVENLQSAILSVAGVNAMMNVTVIENIDKQLQGPAKEKIEEFKNGFLSQLGDGLTEEQKAEKAFTYVVDKLKYVADAKYNQSLYSAALGETVCMGYSAAFKYLCDQMEIPCITVAGTMADGPHAWNMVRLNQMWYQVDCTQGDDLIVYPPKIDYKWFMISNAEMKSTHTLQEPDILPACQ